MAQVRRARAFLGAALSGHLAACQLAGPNIAGMPMPAPSLVSNSAPSLRSRFDKLAMAVGGEKDLLPFIRTSSWRDPDMDDKVPVIPLNWSVSNSALLVIDAKTGRATALGEGIVMVTVTAPGNYQGAAQVSIEIVGAAIVPEVILSPTEKHVVIGDKVQLVPEVRLPDGQINANVVWSSSDDTVATINATTGEATALKVGSVTIVAAYALDLRYKGQAKLIIYNDRADVPPSPMPANLGPTSPPLGAVPIPARRSPAIQFPPAVALPPSSKPTALPSSAPTDDETAEVTTLGTYPADNPNFIAVDGSGSVWVTSKAGNVIKLSSSGEILGTYAAGSWAVCIAFDTIGNAWVTNNDDSVTKLSPEGKPLGNFAVGRGPQGVAVDAAGNVWVANGASNTVTKLSKEGETLGTYEMDAQPTGIAIDDAGNAWVTNMSGIGGDTVIKLSSTGAKLGTYKVGTSPISIDIDAAGNAWVANGGSDNVTKLSPTGETLGTYTAGDEPYSIAIDAADNAWVANLNGKTVTRLSSTGAKLGTYAVGSFPTGVAVDGVGNIWVANNRDSTVTKIGMKP